MPWRRARVLPSGSVGRQAPNPTGRSCVRVALCPDPFPFGRSVHRRSSASTSFVLASLRALHVDPLLGDGGSGAQGEMGVWDVCKLGRSGEGPEVTQVPCSGMVPSLAGGSSSPTGTRGVPLLPGEAVRSFGAPGDDANTAALPAVSQSLPVFPLLTGRDHRAAGLVGDHRRARSDLLDAVPEGGVLLGELWVCQELERRDAPIALNHRVGQRVALLEDQ